MGHLEGMTIAIAQASKWIQLWFLRVKPQFPIRLQKETAGNAQCMKNVKVWEEIAVHLMKVLRWSVAIRCRSGRKLLLCWSVAIRSYLCSLVSGQTLNYKICVLGGNCLYELC
jgi:hypothetical protein